ncbi:MAG: hypothetical protein HY548_06440, partial [Elusimicrobia bacterium]|nr:hypothetical protein [Elusimicrobiota bacterium]
MAEFQVFFEAVDNFTPTAEGVSRQMAESVGKFNQFASQLVEVGDKLNKKLGDIPPKSEEAKGSLS